MVALTQLAAVIVKEVRQTLRDSRMRTQLLMQPVIQLLVFGYAADFSVDHVPTVVVDEDRTSVSRGHLQRLLADGTLELAGEADEVEANEWIDDGRAVAAEIRPASRSVGRRGAGRRGAACRGCGRGRPAGTRRRRERVRAG